jgi:hypothetical protein
LLSTWLFVRILQDRRISLLIAYGVSTALGVYTHLTTAFLVVSHALLWTAWLWGRRHETDWRLDATAALKAMGLGALGSALLYAPLLSQVYGTFQAPSVVAGAVATPGWAVLEALKGLRVGLGAVGVIGAGALVAWGLLSYWRQKPFFAALFVLPALVTAAGIVASGSPIRPRFFFSLLGFAVLLIVRGALSAGERLAAAAGRPARAESLGAAIVAVLILFSAATLPAGYRYPKQDFVGAMRYVSERRVHDEAVATSGLASYPLTRYYGLPWTPIKTLDELNALRAGQTRLWFVYSLPEYMDAKLIAVARKECPLEASLTGTLGGGDIVIRTCAGRPDGIATAPR